MAVKMPQPPSHQGIPHIRPVMNQQVPGKDNTLSFQHRLPKKGPVVYAYQAVESDALLQEKPAPDKPAPRCRADLGKHGAAVPVIRRSIKQEGRHFFQSVMDRPGTFSRLVVIVLRPASKDIRLAPVRLPPDLFQSAREKPVVGIQE